jgi:malonyl CoA-acyl carrier protein transacylase
MGGRNVKTLPLFAEIDFRGTLKYTFSHPHGLLFTTQITQIAFVVTEKAAFEDMGMKGFVQKDCAFAGHSLGEYSALALIADVLHMSALVDIVFYPFIVVLPCNARSNVTQKTDQTTLCECQRWRASHSPDHDQRS